MATKPKKAVFVDGASALNMKRAIGIDLFNFTGLRRVLGHIGTLDVCGPPVITVSPRTTNGLICEMKSAGFAPVALRSDNEEDDLFIRQQIAAVDQSVTEIVIMTCDSGYLATLEARVGLGATVYWVATAHPDPCDKCQMLSHVILRRCQADERFRFVELFRYKQQISRRQR